MQSAGLGTTWIWITILALASLIGLLMQWRGLFPRRVGATPYCRKCGYNLSGTDIEAEDARCPECGTHLLTATAVVRGERIRRRGLIAGGGLLCLVCLSGITAIIISTATGYDWYRLLPTGYVIENLRSNDSDSANRAWRDIQRRDTLSPLSASHRDRLIEVCLDEQTRAEERLGLSQRLLDQLGMYYETGNLSTSQTARMFENTVMSVELTARPNVLPGHKFPFKAISKLRVPSNLYVLYTLGICQLDGAATELLLINSGSTGWLDDRGLCHRIPLADMSPGNHEITVEMEIEIHHGLVSGTSDATPIYKRTETLSTTFELLSEKPPDYIKLTSSPILDDAVMDSISLHEIHRIQSTPESEPYAESLMVVRSGLPVSLAFDALIESQGQVLGRGTVTTMKKKSGSRHCGVYFHELSELPRAVDVRFISSPEAAAQTVEMWKIWDGELLFEGIEVFQLERFSSPIEDVSYKPRLIERE